MNVLFSSTGSVATLRRELVEQPVLEEILLDVRHVVGGDDAAVIADVAAHARSAFGPAKSPTTGTIRFFSSKAFSHLKLSSVAR